MKCWVRCSIVFLVSFTALLQNSQTLSSVVHFQYIPLNNIDFFVLFQVVRYSPGGHYNCHLDSEELQPNMAKCCHLGEFSGPVESQCQLCRLFKYILYQSASAKIENSIGYF